MAKRIPAGGGPGSPVGGGRGAQTAPSSRRVAEILAAAQSDQEGGRLADAERRYREILALDPGHVDSLHNLGILAGRAGRYDIAADLIGRAIALQDRSAGPHANLGVVLKALGRLDEAAASYRRAIALKPDHVEAHNNLGVVLQQQGRLDEAVASYRKALALAPDFPAAHNNLGNSLVLQGRLEEADVACPGPCRHGAVVGQEALQPTWLHQGRPKRTKVRNNRAGLLSMPASRVGLKRGAYRSSSSISRRASRRSAGSLRSAVTALTSMVLRTKRRMWP